MCQHNENNTNGLQIQFLVQVLHTYIHVWSGMGHENKLTFNLPSKKVTYCSNKSLHSIYGRVFQRPIEGGGASFLFLKHPILMICSLLKNQRQFEYI